MQNYYIYSNKQIALLGKFAFSEAAKQATTFPVYTREELYEIANAKNFLDYFGSKIEQAEFYLAVHEYFKDSPTLVALREGEGGEVEIFQFCLPGNAERFAEKMRKKGFEAIIGYQQPIEKKD